MGFWGGLVIGLFIGAITGVFVTALCAAAKEGDETLPYSDYKTHRSDYRI